MTTIERVLWVIFGWGVISAIVVALQTFLFRQRVARLRARGIFPARGAETSAAVAHLHQLGEIDAAARCYQAIHRVSFQAARDRVTGDRLYRPRWLLLTVGLVAMAVIATVAATGHIGLAIGMICFAVFLSLARRYNASRRINR